MKYLLDFDRTVFDMQGLYQAITKHNPGADLGTIASLDGIDLTNLLFPDALEFFASNDPADIDIVSSGFGLTGQWDVDYQTKKIDLSGVAQYINAVHVVADSKIATIKRLARAEDNVTYIDDHPEHVANAVHHIAGLTVVYLDRAQTGHVIKGAQTITTLTDLS